MSALAIALKGYNVDRAFIGLSGGGVGQSMFTLLLHNVLGDMHRYFDMTMYYSDEEMRKQSSALEDIPVTTGQERPEGSNQKLRLHLYKLHISGDPVAQRDLYEKVTRMIELTGWKRFEMNSLLQFAGITEGNFNSLLRRSS